MPGAFAGFTGGMQKKRVELEFGVTTDTEKLEAIKGKIKELKSHLADFTNTTKEKSRSVIKGLDEEKRGLSAMIDIRKQEINTLREGIIKSKERLESLATGRDPSGKFRKRGDVAEEIEDEYKTIYKNKAAVKSLREEINQYYGSMKGVADQRAREIVNTKDALATEGRFIQEQITGWSDMASVMGTDISNRKKEIGLLDKEIKATSRFRFEWLGLMFAGMALQRVFQGYISQMTEMFGITDLLNILMMTFLIPVFKDLLPHIINIFKWFMQLSPSTKKLIGWLIPLTFILGGLLGAVGATALALNSFVGLINNSIALSASLGKGIIWLKGIFIAAIIWLKGIFIAAGGGVALLTSALYALLIGGILVILYGIYKLSTELSKLDNILVEDLPSGFRLLYTLLQGLRLALEVALFPAKMLLGVLLDLLGVMTGDWNPNNIINAFDALMNASSGFASGVHGRTVDIPHLATGGLITKPTLALLGERGPERVVPGGGSSPTGVTNVVNVTATVSDRLDIDLLARRIYDELQRMQARTYVVR